MPTPNDDYPDAPYGADTLRQGKEFQEHAKRLLLPYGLVMDHFEDEESQCRIGENPQGHECKQDNPCTDTDQLSIEVAEKRRITNPTWRDSGIMRQDNTWLYIQGNYTVIFVFSKKWLRRYYRLTNPKVSEFNGTIRRFFLPWDVAMGAAALVIDRNGKRLDA